MFSSSDVVRLLRAEVAPSLGCTEPACAALAAADAALRLTTADAALGRGAADAALGRDVAPARIAVTLSPQLYKNGRSVGIPGYEPVGMDHAAAIGALTAQPELGLEVFCALTPALAQQAQELVEKNLVTVAVDPEHRGVYARVRVEAADGAWAETVIDGGHTRVTERTLNGEPVEVAEQACAAGGSEHDRLVAELLALDVAQIRALVESVPAEELAFLAEGIQMNQEAAAQALAAPSRVGIGAQLQAGAQTGLFGEGLADRASRAVAASIESRLDGAALRIMSSAGAGSKGLAVVLPIAECARQQQATQEQTLRALALGHLLNSWINGKVGKLVAVCTCAVAASTAASAAMAWLMGADDEGIGRAVRSMTATLAGLVCDGAKAGCGMKLSMATQSAVLAAAMGAAGSVLRPTDGIAAATPEAAVDHVARLAHEGMAPADAVMLDIMAQA